MPVYQYACTECGEQLEVRQSFTDAALTECPVCEGRLRKVLNAVGVVFKGSGFYRNDSRASANGDSGSPTPAKEGTAAKGESTSKPDAAKKESTPSSTGSANGSGSGAKGSGDKSGGGKPTPAATR